MTIELIVFLVLAVLAVGTASGLLLSRNAVHAALWLVANFAVVAVFFLILAAPFIAMAQVTVYAGAIMVLFLFVIMLLGAERLQDEDKHLKHQRPLTVFLAVVFAGLLLIFVALSGQALGTVPPAFPSAAAESAFGGPEAIGLTMFSEFILPVQIVGVLLLAALVGAVYLSHEKKANSK